MQDCHGGDIYGGQRVELDFSVNLNPRGVPPDVLRAARDSLEHCARYPDPHCRGLRAAIAHRDGVAQEWVVCGNGAADLIWRLVSAAKPNRALLTAPTFSEYGRALAHLGCRVEEHLLLRQDGFGVTDSILQRIVPGVELVFLCDPNNPTGGLIPLALLQEVLRRCRRVGALLAVDQCFLELTGDAPDKLVGELGGGGLILLRALTKSYALAGLRLGYLLCADGALRRKISGLGPPWPVSIPAQAAGECALQRFPRWPFESLPLIQEERGWLSGQLNGLGLEVYPGQANYLLFRSRRADLKPALLRRGILIRDCAALSGLEAGYYRVGIQGRAEHERLIRALGELTGRNEHG